MHGNISLSIYFQSTVILRKVQTSKNKVRLKPTKDSLIERLCFLEKNCFLGRRELSISTEGEYISPIRRIIDTPLAGFEYVLIQRLLANSLSIPAPITGANDINYGISVNISGDIFQLFEKMTWRQRIKQQAMKLPVNIAQDVGTYISSQRESRYLHKGYFPIHDLPQDACFVIRHSELEKLINILVKEKKPQSPSIRISTPLSRMFWLACKHNETISPLINQPYKLLSIFEQWASAEGITDRLSGDTLKTALERGSPTPVSAPN